MSFVSYKIKIRLLRLHFGVANSFQHATQYSRPESRWGYLNLLFWGEKTRNIMLVWIVINIAETFILNGARFYHSVTKSVVMVVNNLLCFTGGPLIVSWYPELGLIVMTYPNFKVVDLTDDSCSMNAVWHSIKQVYYSIFS